MACYIEGHDPTYLYLSSVYFPFPKIEPVAEVHLKTAGLSAKIETEVIFVQFMDLCGWDDFHSGRYICINYIFDNEGQVLLKFLALSISTS